MALSLPTRCLRRVTSSSPLQCRQPSLPAAAYHSRRQIPAPPPEPGTYEDIIRLQDAIDEMMTERDELRERTLPMQVADNRLRAVLKDEAWKLGEFDAWKEREEKNAFFKANPEEWEKELAKRAKNAQTQAKIKAGKKLAREKRIAELNPWKSEKPQNYRSRGDGEDRQGDRPSYQPSYQPSYRRSPRERLNEKRETSRKDNSWMFA